MVGVVDIVLGSPVSFPYHDEAKPVVLKEDSTVPMGILDMMIWDMFPLQPGQDSISLPVH